MPEERLVIRVDEKGAIVASRNIDSVGTSATAAGSALTLLKGALVALAGAVVIKQLIGMADAFTILQNKLKIVTTGQENLNDVTSKLFDIATRTRSSFAETASGYSKFALAAKDLSRSQEEMLRFTELVNKAVVIGGSTSQEASGGLRQLSQGLASGALRGDELISVLENLPFVADTIAKELGVTRGALRDMGKAGKITAEIVLDAFKNQADFLDTTYKKTMITVSQAVTLLQNSFLRLVGNFDVSVGATLSLADGIGKLAKNIDTAVIVTKALAIVLTLTFSRQIVGQAAIAMTNLSKAILSTVGSMNTLSTRAIPKLIASVKALGVAFKQLWAAIINNPLIALGAILIAGTVAALDVLNKKMDEAEAAQDRAHSIALQMIRARLKVVQAVAEENKAITKFTKALRQENALLKLGEKEREVRIAFLKAEKAKGKELVDSERTIIRTLVEEGQAIKASNNALAERSSVIDSIKGPQLEFERQSAIVTGLLEDQTFSADEAALAMARLRDELASASRAPKVDDTKTQDPVSNLISSLERENVLLKLNNVERQREATILQLKDQLEAGDELDPGKEKEIRALMALNDEQERSTRLLNEIKGPARQFRAELASLIQLEETGKITAEELRQKTEELKNAFDDGPASAGAGTGDQILSDLFNNGVNALEDLDRSWKTFVTGFLADLARIAQQKILTNLTSKLGSLNIPGFAGGGQFTVGGSGGTDSQPVAFSATPGERVSVETPAQQRQAVPSVASPVVNLKIVNVQDREMVREEMASAEGEEIILNTVSKNGTTIRQAIS